MKKFIIIFFLVGCILNANSQSKSESYKYVVVPLQYEFLKGKDKYRLNTQTRYLLKKEGFNVYFDEGEQLPEDLFKNRCLAMYADVHEVKGGFLKQKIKISFKDCYGQLLLESEEGTSKEKNLNVAYKEALERAFVTLDFSKIENKTSPKEQDLENEPAKEEKVITEKPVQEAEVIEVVETKETEVPQPEIEEEVVMEEKEVVNPNSEKSTVYYAQKIAGGFQLVDAEPKIIMVLLATASPDIFMVKDKNAMVLKKDGNWVYSENENGQMMEKPINIKF